VDMEGVCSNRAFRNPFVGKQYKSVFTDTQLFCAPIISATDTVHVNIKYMDSNNKLT
jgi:hypothetical protein